MMEAFLVYIIKGLKYRINFYFGTLLKINRVLLIHMN